MCVGVRAGIRRGLQLHSPSEGVDIRPRALAPLRACMPPPPSPVSVLSRYRVPRAHSVGRWKETLTGWCALGPGALELGEGATFLLGDGATFLSVGSGFLAAAAPPFAPPALAAALGGPDALMMAKRPSSSMILVFFSVAFFQFALACSAHNNHHLSLSPPYVRMRACAWGKAGRLQRYTVPASLPAMR